MSNKATNRSAVLAAGIFFVIAPAMHAQEPNPDSMKQDQTDLARARKLENQDDRSIRGLTERIRRLEIERNGVSSQLNHDEKT